MSDEQREFANRIVTRLNLLIASDPEVKRDIERLILARVPCSSASAKHPYIEVRMSSTDGTYSLGIMGLLNGIVGSLSSGEKIVLRYNVTTGEITHFSLEVPK